MGIFFSTSSSDKIRRQKELDSIRGLNTDDFVKKLQKIASQFILSGDFKSYVYSKDTAMNQCGKILLLLEQLSGGDFYKIDAFYKTIGDISDSKRLNENERRKQFICSQIMAYYRKVYDIYEAIEKVFNLKGDDKERKGINILKFTAQARAENTKFDLFNNLCQERINALNNIFTTYHSKHSGSELEFQEENKKELCNLSKSLSDKTGIDYMETLYNDVYDLSNKKNKFEKKSEKLQKIYNQDLQNFKNEILKISPEDSSQQARKFSNIRIGKLPKNINMLCTRKMDSITIDANDSNYIEFEEDIKEMKYNYHKYLLKLNDILHTLFTKSKGKYLLNPELKKADIDKLADNTAFTIQNMYVACEFDYIKALKKLEAIVETGQARRNIVYAR